MCCGNRWKENEKKLNHEILAIVLIILFFLSKNDWQREKRMNINTKKPLNQIRTITTNIKIKWIQFNMKFRWILFLKRKSERMTKRERDRAMCVTIQKLLWNYRPKSNNFFVLLKHLLYHCGLIDLILVSVSLLPIERHHTRQFNGTSTKEKETLLSYKRQSDVLTILCVNQPMLRSNRIFENFQNISTQADAYSLYKR